MQDRTQKIIIAVLALLLVVVSGVLVSRAFFAEKPEQVAVAPVENQNLNIPPANVNVGKPVVAAHDLIPNKSILNEYAGLSVNWLIPAVNVDAKTIAAEIGKNIPAPKKINGDTTENPVFSRVGTISASTTAKYVNANLYRITTSCGIGGGINCIDILAIADPANKNFVVLSRYSGNSGNGMSLESGKIDYPLTNLAILDANTAITDLEPPSALALNSSGYLLTATYPTTGTPNADKYEPTALTLDGTKIYTQLNNYPVPAGLIWARLPDGEYIRYDLTIPFYSDKRIPAITWLDGKANTADYSPYTAGGCGGSIRLGAVNESDLKGKLEIAGKTSNGEDIFIPSDVNDKIFTDLYAQYSTSTDSGQKLSLQEFVASHPIFYWHDPFGELVAWTGSDIQPMAECGKPVVYLYPTKTEAVGVKLGSNITVEKSEPQYDNGWKVTAEPNGTLTNADGKTFPYLYWDGNGASYNTPTTGFVVARNDVEATLRSKLAQLGLNTKEISDFNEFWLPIVTKSPYALISFVPQDEWSKAAPLSISPAPETLIRVFMDWKPLSAPITIAPQTLPPTPIRSGFTAVEWGGLLYR